MNNTDVLMPLFDSFSVGLGKKKISPTSYFSFYILLIFFDI